MNSDLGFLAIFIILPTILIVSGFWLILIVRSDMRLRHAPETTTQDEESGLVHVGGDAAQTERALELPASSSSIDDKIEEEFWTPPEPDPSRSPTDASLPGGLEIEALPEPDATPEVLPPPPVFANDTENLPEQWEIDLAADQDDENQVEAPCDDDSNEDRQSRQPGSLMVPSTKNVMRRTGQPVRPSPAVRRSSSRDEDPVESPDGG